MSFLEEAVPRVHVFMYRLSNGTLGGRRSESKVLLLSTTGRKTGKERVTPLRYIKHGDDFVIAASNWGQENPPAWYFNLKANPNITIQDMDQRIKVKAEEANKDLHEQLYPLFIKADSRFADYPTTAKRQIPLILLHPQR